MAKELSPNAEQVLRVERRTSQIPAFNHKAADSASKTGARGSAALKCQAALRSTG
jgi:hypothetical protein